MFGELVEIMENFKMKTITKNLSFSLVAASLCFSFASQGDATTEYQSRLVIQNGGFVKKYYGDEQGQGAGIEGESCSYGTFGQQVLSNKCRGQYKEVSPSISTAKRNANWSQEKFNTKTDEQCRTYHLGDKAPSCMARGHYVGYENDHKPLRNNTGDFNSNQPWYVINCECD